MSWFSMRFQLVQSLMPDEEKNVEKKPLDSIHWTETSISIHFFSFVKEKYNWILMWQTFLIDTQSTKRPFLEV